MTRRRWIADEVSGDRAAIIGNHARHVRQVLRAQVGQEFHISTGTEVRRGRVSRLLPDRIEFELGETIAHPHQSVITVALSVFKFDRMEWAIEKCTELGVARVIPIITGRTAPHLAAAAAKRVERWRRIALQAAEQSRRVAPPDIVDPMKLKELAAVEGELRIVLSEDEARLMLRDAIPPGSGSVILAFGPEGGWKEQEIQALREHGWISASLGNSILRAETAVIAGVSIAAAMSG